MCRGKSDQVCHFSVLSSSACILYKNLTPDLFCDPANPASLNPTMPSLKISSETICRKRWFSVYIFYPIGNEETIWNLNFFGKISRVWEWAWSEGDGGSIFTSNNPFLLGLL